VGNATTGNIWALFVDPAHERQGYGRQLQDVMVRWLFEQGLPRLYLSTAPGTRAQRFYAASGWKSMGLDDHGDAAFERFNPVTPVQGQLDAYNARDLGRFMDWYADTVVVYRPPAAEPVLRGKAALAAHYAAKRFNLPNLHAALLNRMVVGNQVIDHERIVGVGEHPVDAAAVYEVVDGLIQTVWFYSPD